MARVYKVEDWQDNDVLSVDDHNAELEAQAGEVNGHVDRDNFDAAMLTPAKFVLDTFNELVFIEGPTAGTYVEGDVLASATVTTGDGRLEVEGHIGATGGGTGKLGFSVAVRVDGTPVCRSGTTSTVPPLDGLDSADSVCAVGASVVGPGDHLVELVVQLWEALPALAGVGTPAITAVGGGVLCRFVRR